jgi:hypothetical protein
MSRSLLWSFALTPWLLFGCPSADDDDTAAADDDDTTAGGDDDTAADDDDDTDVPSMSLSETAFYAGAWPTVQLITRNFEIGEETQWCCYDETALQPSSTANVTPHAMELMLTIGLLAEGTQTLGLENAGTQVSAELQITAFPIDDVVVGTAPESGVAGGDTEYDAFHILGASGGRFVTFTPTNLGTDFQPYMWLTEDDGITFRAHNGYPPDDSMAGAVGVYMFEGAELYARICAADFVNDPNQTFDLDVTVATPLASLEETEVEPNDDGGDPQDLGMFAAGTTVLLTGEVEAVGHDAQNVWNADLDFYAFEVSHDTTLSVQLDWGDGANDYDLLMFDVSSSEPDLTRDETLVGWRHAASQDYPERTSSVLYAGIPYVLFVGGWDGIPGEYEVLMALSPVQ